MIGFRVHPVSQNLNSSKGAIWGTTIGVIKRDARSVDRKP